MSPIPPKCALTELSHRYGLNERLHCQRTPLNIPEALDEVSIAMYFIRENKAGHLIL